MLLFSWCVVVEFVCFCQYDYGKLHTPIYRHFRLPFFGPIAALRPGTVHRDCFPSLAEVGASFGEPGGASFLPGRGHMQSYRLSEEVFGRKCLLPRLRLMREDDKAVPGRSIEAARCSSGSFQASLYIRNRSAADVPEYRIVSAERYVGLSAGHGRMGRRHPAGEATSLRPMPCRAVPARGSRRVRRCSGRSACRSSGAGHRARRCS